MSYLSDYLGEKYKEGMTEDELSAALEEINKKAISNALTKANSESANYKNKMKEAMDTATNANTETEALKQRIAELERSNKVSARKSQFIANGFDENQADEMANAYADGDMDKIFELQQAYLSEKTKNLKAEILKATPKPVTGGETKAEESETSIAETLGKLRADKNKRSQDIINMYTKGD